MTPHIQHTECICGQPNCPLHGLCHCGCGKPAKPTKVWRPTRGLAKGQPQKWLIGHQSRANTGTLEAGHFKIEGVYCRLIPLSRGLYAIVWESDYESLIRHKWHARRNPRHPGYYAARTVRHGKTREMVYMHRELLGLQPGDGIEVDHADNLATLNNARSNIRSVSGNENRWNTRLQKRNKLGIKGVSKVEGYELYGARIRANGVVYNLGYFRKKEKAAAAYAEAAKMLHGKFARLK